MLILIHLDSHVVPDCFICLHIKKKKIIVNSIDSVLVKFILWEWKLFAVWQLDRISHIQTTNNVKAT